jgi:hypothetical protein
MGSMALSDLFFLDAGAGVVDMDAYPQESIKTTNRARGVQPVGGSRDSITATERSMLISSEKQKGVQAAIDRWQTSSRKK